MTAPTSTGSSTTLNLSWIQPETESTRFVVHTMEEADMLAQHLAQWCPNPINATIGLCELFYNAVEHGNLGISYEEKSQLHAMATWETEIARRIRLPENIHKNVTVQVWKTQKELTFLIQDQGNGFDWRPFMTIDPMRLLHSHGRGIAWAKTLSFDQIEYLGNGNTVVAVIHLPGS